MRSGAERVLPYMMMNDGCTQDSKIPSRKRTTIRVLKSLAAAEQAITKPQQNTFADKYLATGSFWSSKLVGYSPTRIPM
jgi:hypothetical protein